MFQWHSCLLDVLELYALGTSGTWKKAMILRRFNSSTGFHVAELIINPNITKNLAVYGFSFFHSYTHVIPIYSIWRFPEIGLPLVIIHFRLGFSLNQTPGIIWVITINHH